MSLTAPFMPDTIPVTNGAVVTSTPVAAFKAQFPSYKTPTKNFSLHYNGHTVQFYANVPFTYDAGLLAALVAANAPIV